MNNLRLRPSYVTWILKHGWPRDPKGYIFLARAVNKLHEHIFSESIDVLSITRPLHHVEFSLDKHPEEVVELFWRANRTISTCDISQFDIEIDFLREKAKNFFLATRLNDEDRAEAVRLNDEIRFKNQRFQSSVAQIAGWVADGEISYSVRLEEGGTLDQRTNTGIWNTETRLGVIFDKCALTEYDIDGSEMSLFIFLNEAEFQQRVSASSIGSPQTQYDMHLSPYLKLMLDTVRRLGISPQNQPKKIHLIEELSAHWPRSVPKTNNLIDAMATLLREPESQLGRARKPPSIGN